MQKIHNVLDALKKFSREREDGTYDFYTGTTVSYESGYQVSFVRPEAFEQLNEDEWDILTNYLCHDLDSKAHIGLYDKNAEISFCCQSEEKSRETMVRFNQESMLDWAMKKKEPRAEAKWFIINRFYEKGMRVEYDKILREIQ